MKAVSLYCVLSACLVLSRQDALTDQMNELQTKLQTLTNRYEETVKEVTALKTQQGQAEGTLFQVRLQANLYNVTDNSTLVFDDVVYNNGNGYDVTSGVFTSPTSGTFLFWCYINILEKYELTIKLLKNGVPQAFGYCPPKRDYRVASLTTLLKLTKGDKVLMSKVGSPDMRGQGYSNFGGVLLNSLSNTNSSSVHNMSTTSSSAHNTGTTPSSVYKPMPTLCFKIIACVLSLYQFW